MDETEENTEAKPSDENESSSEEEENEVFSVEQIVSHKRQNGRYKYRIRWHGYEEDQGAPSIYIFHPFHCFYYV